MKYILIEFAKFFRDYLLKILIGTIIVTIVAGGAKWVVDSNLIFQEDEFTEEPSNEDINFEAKPATFQFFVEYPDGSVFSNENLISQYIMNPDVLEEASLETNTNLFDMILKTENDSIIEDEVLLEIVPESTLKTLGISRDRNSHVIRFYVNIGNEEYNQRIANYFFDYIIGDSIPFLNDKPVYVFQTPQLLEADESDIIDSEESDGWSSLVSTLILIIMFGFVLMTGIFLIASFFSKRLHYFYTYSLQDSDYFFLLDDKLNNKDDLLKLSRNLLAKDIVVVQENDNNTLSKKLDINLQNKVNSILEYENLDEIKSLVYIIEEGITTREWYNNQRKFDKLLGKPIVVIQLNN